MISDESTTKLQLLTDYIRAEGFVISETSTDMTKDWYELLVKCRKYVLSLGLLIDPLILFNDFGQYCIQEYLREKQI